jgi:hypothetical protein
MFGFGKEKAIPSFLGDASEVPMELKDGKTLYDIQLEAAQKIESKEDYRSTPRVNDLPLEDEKYDVQEIENQFLKLSEKEVQQRENERRGMGTKFDEHARGANSKPIEKDYKGGESTRNDISI